MKLIEGLKDAIAGNLDRVTIDGQTWVRESQWQSIETAPKDREILVWPSVFSNRDFDTAQFDYDRYATKPRPFWRRASPASITQSRSSPPVYWQLPPLPPLKRKE